MKHLKYIIFSLSVFLFAACFNNRSKDEIELIEKKEQIISVKLNSDDYNVYYVFEKELMEKSLEELSEFRKHLNYQDSFIVDLYLFEGKYIANFPNKLTLGQASFLCSWMSYGYTIAKNKISSDKDLLVYNDKVILKNDFVACVQRDSRLFFKVSIVDASFQGLENNCYSYEPEFNHVAKKLNELPTFFNLTNSKFVSRKYYK